MIQRIQSVYLLLGAASIFAMLFLDETWTNRAADVLGWYVPVVFAAGTLVAVVAIAAIFLYRNRDRQLKVVVALQVITVIFLAALYGGLYLAGEFDLIRETGLTVAILALLILPIVAYVFFYLARRGIQKDVNLVRSMDRLR